MQLENKRRFYIEAKHTKYDLHIRTDYIWQAYSYSYSTQVRPQYEKVDFALLTDFEEFRFFDCTFPVKNHETLNNYCVLDWTFKDYIKNFDKLWEYFEKENVRNGSLDKLYISEKKIKENRIPPDRAFLKDLDDEKNGWRIKLAKDVKKYLSPDPSPKRRGEEAEAEFITQTVQLILDRFIFIKVLVDREIEEDYIEKIVNKLKSIKDKEEGIVYEECKDVFEQLDKTYNGSIFTRRTELDAVRVSNKVLLDVLKDFLSQNSRYNFKVIPIEILGTIYEQFLGKVVITTAKQAKIDYKPEVRKAGGVYYTPAYIVDYIVKKTVEEKLRNLALKGEVKIQDILEIKICDPACGSGSFLISAYSALIQWTLEYFRKKIESANVRTGLKPVLTKEEKTLVYLDNDGNIRLTSKIKRDILKSCIYGVDIDPQAVEVTKMSLSLKALENTNHYEVYNERTLFHTTIPPPLEGNIKCGNSLIGMDIYDGKLQLNDSVEKILKPFDWNSEFLVFKEKQGFDVVIGNPPYIHQRDNMINEIIIEYLKGKFISSNFRQNTYTLFVEKSLTLLNENGYFSFIIPNYFLSTDFDKKFRELLFTKNKVISILDVKNVFEQATVFCVIFVMQKGKPSNFISYFERKTFLPALLNNITDEKKFIPLENNDYKLSFGQITKKFKTIGDFFKTYMGIVPYRIGYGIPKQTKKLIQEKSYNSSKKENNHYLPYYTASDIGFFEIKRNKEFIKYGNNLAEPRNLNVFSDQRIVIQRIIALNPPRLKTNIFTDKAVVNSDLITIKPIKKEYEKFVLFLAAIVSSKYFGYLLYNNNINLQRSIYPKINMKTLLSIEIPDLLRIADDTLKKVSNIVDNTIELKRKLTNNISEPEKAQLLRKIKYFDDNLNSIVYQLYELTPEEIKIVEGKG
ncbi:MAG: N-6 DNA methylase [Leptospiraceae bacterium]|nr:N-6 DNA methylase [Leptospiraceae bacterium]